jgi:uncharacterized protein (TIGR02466 family)
MILHTIFPTVVTFDTLEREFTQEEKDFFEKISKDTYKNIGNTTSTNNYLLNEPEMANIKTFIQSCVNGYLDTVCNLADGHHMEITQSWTNYSEKGQFHSRHWHENSFLSGVFYINAKKDLDKIYFFNSQKQQIKPEIKEWTVLNSPSWFFPVESMQLVLFPSTLEHMVQTVESDETRVSLAFNTFFKGTIGSNKNLTELKI